MTKLKAIGGDRIGAGGKVEVENLKFTRSTHNLSTIRRTTAAPGVVFPFLYDMLLPQDDAEINFNAEVLTLPTNGPLFGSFIFDIHVFTSDVRNYQADIQQDLLEIGNNMQLVKLPQIVLAGKRLTEPTEEQIEPSALMAHLDMMGLGLSSGGTGPLYRWINALGVLTYYDIIKCYYANKQEENAFIIHTPIPETIETITNVAIQYDGPFTVDLLQYPNESATVLNGASNNLAVLYTGETPAIDSIVLTIRGAGGTGDVQYAYAKDMWNYVTDNGTELWFTELRYPYWAIDNYQAYNWAYTWQLAPVPQVPQLHPFPLKNIDQMRINILKAAGTGTHFIINKATNLAPYTLMLESNEADGKYSLQYPLEGLAVKTYQSDLLQNWVKTEWVQSVTSRSAISTAGGSFTMDTLNMAQKVYTHLTALAMAGGTYYDWIEVAYSTNKLNRSNNPVYHGGLRKSIAFQEVVGMAATEGQPLGQLAGRGVMTKEHKGGTVHIRPREHTVLMATFSITPKIDYTQGNSWINNLSNMDQFHKPIFDQIGFQDSINEERAWWSTSIDATNNPTMTSAGKVPAWVNYMTKVNTARGNFAKENNQMFMILARRYQYSQSAISKIGDMTTYIDPSHFNYIFADADITAQNFWVHIGIDYKITREMSAKIMPQFQQ